MSGYTDEVAAPIFRVLQGLLDEPMQRALAPINEKLAAQIVQSVLISLIIPSGTMIAAGERAQTAGESIDRIYTAMIRQALRETKDGGQIHPDARPSGPAPIPPRPRA